MGLIVKMQPSTFQAVEEGDYIVELSEVQSRDGKFGPALDFRFKIVEGEYAGTEISGLVSATLQPGNKLDKWLRALGVNTLEVGQELDVESLVGHQAKAYVVPTPGKKEGQVFNNVQTIRPYKSSVVKAAVATPPSTPAVTPPTPKAGKSEEGIEW